MAHTRRTSLTAPPGAEDDLARLIALEHQLGVRLDAARRDHAAEIASARERAAALESGLETELRVATEAMRQELAATTHARITALEAAAERRRARYAEVDAATTERLAEVVLRWLATPDAGSTP